MNRPRTRMRIDAGVVGVVTGAAGGIGRGVAEALAARGAAIALVDVDEPRLADARAVLAAGGARVSAHAVDVSDRAAMAALPDAVAAAHGGVHLLACNAGVAVAGRFDQVPLADLEWIVGVNFWGTVHACHAFLPHLKRAPAAHVAIVLSDFALVGFPSKTHYCATKFACRGFAEALRAELHGSTVGLTAVYPGPVDTALVRTSRGPDAAKRERCRPGLRVRVAFAMVRRRMRMTTRALTCLCALLVALGGAARAADEPPKEKKMGAGKTEDQAIAQIDQFIAEQKIDKSQEGWKTKLPKPPKLTFTAGKKYVWNLTTNKGAMKIRLMPDVAPMHASSTIYLTRLGFYDGITFHRVIGGFMAQGGDPLGTGTGGPGYKYDGEFDAKVKHDKPGILSMANAGPGTDGSQFFLTFVPTPHLDGRHTVFGEVISGQDVLKKLEAAGSPSGKTTEPLKIEKATITVE